MENYGARGPTRIEGCATVKRAFLALLPTLLSRSMHRTFIGIGSSSLFVLLALVVACGPAKPAETSLVHGNPAAASQPSANAPMPTSTVAVTVETITDDSGHAYQIQQGPRGEPGTLGCADGQREAFVDHNAFPHIAGCVANWEGAKSMRAPGTGTPCGDDGSACNVPADACAPGWHVCASNGNLAELRQVSGTQCEQAGGGRFSSGTSHCQTQDGCQYDMTPSANYSCFDSGWCSESVCCGSDCGEFGACTGGVWENLTHIAVGTDQGCGASTSQRAGGVLCCNN